MYQMTAGFLLIILTTAAAGASIEQEKTATDFALEIAALRNPTRAIPKVLERIVAEFAYYHWERLLDVFPETTESRQFREYVKACKQNGTLAAVDERDWCWDPIEVDCDGNIFRMVLSNQQLTDRSIGDLSKLPSTLRVLQLNGNNLTTLDVAALPRGLQGLYLRKAHLSKLDLTKLPPKLDYLGLEDNNLSTVNLNALPASLKFISLNGNQLRSVNLSKVPRSMSYIFLTWNHLKESDFNSIPVDGRVTAVLGQGYQRSEHS